MYPTCRFGQGKPTVCPLGATTRVCHSVDQRYCNKETIRKFPIKVTYARSQPRTSSSSNSNSTRLPGAGTHSRYTPLHNLRRTPHDFLSATVLYKRERSSLAVSASLRAHFLFLPVRACEAKSLSHVGKSWSLVCLKSPFISCRRLPTIGLRWHHNIQALFWLTLRT